MKQILDFINESANVLKCSSALYSIIDVNGSDVNTVLLHDVNEMWNYLEGIYDEEEFDEVMEMVDSELVYLSCVKLKHSEDNYQIVSCFDKNRKH